jgi:hypothetical protein
MNAGPYRLHELDEVRGQLYHIETCDDGGLLCLIEQIPVILPAEMDDRLRELLGCKIGVLRLGGYHVRRLDGGHA